MFHVFGCSGCTKFSLCGMPRSSYLEMLFICNNYCAKLLEEKLKPCMKSTQVCYWNRISPKSTLMGMYGWTFAFQHSYAPYVTYMCEFASRRGCTIVLVEKQQSQDGHMLLHFSALWPWRLCSQAVAHTLETAVWLSAVHIWTRWMLPTSSSVVKAKKRPCIKIRL